MKKQLFRLKYYIDEHNLKDKLLQIAYQSLRYIITPESIKSNLIGQANYNNLMRSYFNLNQWLPSISKYITANLPLPNEVKTNKFFDQDLKALLEMNDQKLYMHFYRTLNKLILPLVKKKLKYLYNPNIDKVGDNFDIEIKNIDFDNRAIPFIIYNDEFILDR